MIKKINTPICIFLFLRHENIQFMLRTLSNFEVKDLYLFIDKPLTKDLESRQEQVINLVDEFKKLNIRNLHIEFRKYHFGLKQNIKNGIIEVLKKHDSLVVLEDDAKITENTIIYLDSRLRSFADFDEIGHVSAYTQIPHYLKSENCATASIFPSTYAWGTWLKKWNFYKEDFSNQELWMICKYIYKKTHNFSICFIWMSNYHLAKNKYIDSWATFWTLSLILNNNLSTYPSKNTVQYIGNENGSHTRIKPKYLEQKLAIDLTAESDILFYSQEVNNWLAVNVYRGNFRGIILRILNYGYIYMKIILNRIKR